MYGNSMIFSAAYSPYDMRAIERLDLGTPFDVYVAWCKKHPKQKHGKGNNKKGKGRK